MIRVGGRRRRRSWPIGRGRITFEVLARAIGALVKPVADEGKTLGERQADALGEICENAPDEGRLPVEGGERPHLTAVPDYEALREPVAARDRGCAHPGCDRPPS